MLMALHPFIQERAQEEIDSNFGRVPRVSEVYRLPYLLAVFKEVMRYAPVANLGMHSIHTLSLSLSLSPSLTTSSSPASSHSSRHLCGISHSGGINRGAKRLGDITRP
jgi:hypothetical protein